VLILYNQNEICPDYSEQLINPARARGGPVKYLSSRRRASIERFTLASASTKQTIGIDIIEVENCWTRGQAGAHMIRARRAHPRAFERQPVRLDPVVW
jgi:hypothetical protein